MQNDYEIFADNAAPFNSIKLLSTGYFDSCVKQHIADIAAQTVSKEYQLSAQSAKSVTIFKQEKYNEITSIALSNDTHTLFVANGKGIITQYQKEESSLNYYHVRTFKGHYKWINSISLSNSKMNLLSASNDWSLRVWDLENGTQIAHLNDKGKKHQESIQRCCWNDEDTLFASGDYVGGVVVWSTPLSIYNTSNQFIAKFKFKAEGDETKISCLKFQKNGLDLFASYSEVNLYGDYSGVIRLWSINEKELLDSKSAVMHQQNTTMPFFQKPNLESEQLNGKIDSFDVRGSILVVGVKEEMLSLSADSLQSMADAVQFKKVHNDEISPLVFSKDGKYIASGSYNGSMAIFDSKSGKCVKLIENAHKTWIKAVVFEI